MKSVRRMPWRLLLIFVLTSTAFAGGAIRVRGFAPGSQEPATLNAGLPASEYGYHPENDGSWGESWSVQCINANGDHIYVLMSISNYHPLHKFGGTVDLFYYPAGGGKFEAHREFKNDRVQADKHRVYVNIGGNIFQGAHPTYRLRAKLGELALDLTFQASTPALRLGQGFIRFGENAERYWNLTVLGPRATVRGTVSANGRSVPYQGLAYFDHGWSNYKLYEFSHRWYVIRLMQDDMSLNAIRMIFKEDFAPREAQAIYLTLGDQIIANSGALKLSADGAYHHAPSGLSIPTRYTIDYQQGQTQLTGTVKMTKLVEGLNVLHRLSPILRKVISALVTDPWQFRFAGEADLTLTHQGQARKITGLVGGEVHHYK